MDISFIIFFRAGLIFPVSRVENELRARIERRRLSPVAPVYLTAVVEYLAAAILGSAVQEASRKGLKIISPEIILEAVQQDSELKVLLGESMPQSPDGGEKDTSPYSWEDGEQNEAL